MELINAETINWYLVNQEPFIRRRLKIAQLLAVMMYPWVLDKNRADAWDWWQQPVGKALSQYLPFFVSEFIRYKWNRDFSYWKPPRGLKKEALVYARYWASVWNLARELEEKTGWSVVDQFCALYGESLAAGGLLLPITVLLGSNSGKDLLREMQRQNRVMQKRNESPFPSLPKTTEFLIRCYAESSRGDGSVEKNEFKENFYDRFLQSRMKLATHYKSGGMVAVTLKGVDGRALHQIQKKLPK